MPMPMPMRRATPTDRPLFTRRLIIAVTAVLLLGAASVRGGGDGGWITGRTTWYDDSPWMSVHKGSCRFGYLGNRYGGKGNWHVAAMNDGNPDYNGVPGPYQHPAGSCGKCYEMRCEAMNFKDGYGVSLDRTKVCKTSESIIITITDTCPCSKPGNEYSNRRWCCSDMNHFDTGVWAFSKLADPKWGVIGIKYRPVSCPTGEWPDSGSEHVTAMEGGSQDSNSTATNSTTTQG